MRTREGIQLEGASTTTNANGADNKKKATTT